MNDLSIGMHKQVSFHERANKVKEENFILIKMAQWKENQVERARIVFLVCNTYKHAQDMAASADIKNEFDVTIPSISPIQFACWQICSLISSDLIHWKVFDASIN